MTPQSRYIIWKTVTLTGLLTSMLLMLLAVTAGYWWHVWTAGMFGMIWAMATYPKYRAAKFAKSIRVLTGFEMADRISERMGTTQHR